MNKKKFPKRLTVTRSGTRLRPRLGFKGIRVQNGEMVEAGSLLAQQSKLKYKPGANVKLDENNSLLALEDGLVRFRVVHSNAQEWDNVIEVEPLNKIEVQPFAKQQHQ